TMTNTQPASPTTSGRSHLGWVLGLTSIAYFMVVLDSVVVITALPRMQRDLHVSLSLLQWTLNAYGIAFAAGIITAAAFGDRIGRRKMFNIGLALFTLASAACALAPNASWLIAARTVQGLGGAIVLPLSLTILTTAFPADRRGTIVGIYGGLAGLAVAMGPIVGGAVTQGINWHWIFWINVPVGVVAVVLGLRLLAESYGPPQRLDLVGVGLVTGGVVAVVWALTRANAAGWLSAEVISTLVVGAALLVAFIRWERSAAEPLVPLRMFASRDFTFGNLTTFLMTGAIFAAGFLVTEEFQLARGYSPVSAGLRLLPFFGTPMLVSPLAGALSDRIGRRPIMVTGLMLLTASFVWVAWTGSLGTSWVELVIALFIGGAGISMALPTVPTAVMSAVAPQEMGKASGINYMSQRFGAVFAIAIGTAVFTKFGGFGTPHTVTAGFTPALWACTVLALLAALCKAIFPDLKEDLQDIIASGDTVATRWVITGSQQQEFMGIPASGQPIRVEGMNFYRLKDGRVTDIWTQFDGVTLMQQLGTIPA
ncbi:MAG TPA: DHA2 family efflux MFS transporter permease subunit, partial [Acidimicrobiales bacterium]|nr:DHA2 family efflux MFS transporter permease subunit [Acidimicrobiales bacterium]